VLFALIYLLMRRALRLVAGSASELHNDIEVMVVRHQLAVLKRQVGRPRLRRRGRLFMAAVSRVLPRSRWSSFIVSPQTLLRRSGLGPAPRDFCALQPPGDRPPPSSARTRRSSAP